MAPPPEGLFFQKAEKPQEFVESVFGQLFATGHLEKLPIGDGFLFGLQISVQKIIGICLKQRIGITSGELIALFVFGQAGKARGFDLSGKQRVGGFRRHVAAQYETLIICNLSSCIGHC